MRGPRYLSSTARLFSLNRRGIDAVGHGLVLQVALAALVADRAVERVVDEQELHHPLAGLLDRRRLGADHRRLAVRARPAVAHRPGAGGDRLRRALQFDEAHAAIAGDRQPLVEAEARDLGPRRLRRLQQRVFRRNLDLDAVDDELGHAFSLGGCESFASRFRGPETIENGKLASPRLRGEGCRRQQACAAGEGEGAVTKEALRHGQRLLRDRPLTPASLRSARSAEGRTLSPQAGRGEFCASRNWGAHRSPTPPPSARVRNAGSPRSRRCASRSPGGNAG